MKIQSDVRPARATARIVDGASRHLRRCVGGPLFGLTVGLLTAIVILASPVAVLSQAIQLVRVDVQTVANGYRVSKLDGQTVVNDKNENIGKIDDFVIGHDEGHSLFTILQVGGFLGIGSHLVAVPYDSLTIDQNGKKIELPGATKDQLKALTEFRYGS
jgi:sporulation protein YlmC with PRC-barrel domain